MTSCSKYIVKAISLRCDCFSYMSSESFSLVFAVPLLEPQLKSNFETYCQEEVHHSSFGTFSPHFDVRNAMREDCREFHDRDELSDSHSIFEDGECFLSVLCSFFSEGVPLGQVLQIILFLPLFNLLMNQLVIFQLLLPSAAPLKE